MADTPSASLGDSFKNFFEIVPALDDELVNDVFFIRHEVYARDLGFEPVREDQRETDKYDRHSLHCLVRTSQHPARLAGCARLILPDPLQPAAPLPFEIYCEHSLDRSLMDPAQLPRDRIAEVSRLAVMSGFRRRKGEQGREALVTEQDFGDARQPRFPYIPISLYMGAVLMAKRMGIDYLFTLTEPRLAGHFAKLGVNICPIGAPVDHRGLRVPSVIEVAEIPERVRAMIRPLWTTIESQMMAVYALPAPAGVQKP